MGPVHLLAFRGPGSQVGICFLALPLDVQRHGALAAQILSPPFELGTGTALLALVDFLRGGDGVRFLFFCRLGLAFLLGRCGGDDFFHGGGLHGEQDNFRIHVGVTEMIDQRGTLGGQVGFLGHVHLVVVDHGGGLGLVNTVQIHGLGHGLLLGLVVGFCFLPSPSHLPFL